jgi:S1-C subfamily serine protease
MDIWIHRHGKLAGRFPESAIRGKIQDGSFDPTDYAWNNTAKSWQTISEFLSLGAPPPIPAAQPSPAQAGAPASAAPIPAMATAPAPSHAPPSRNILSPTVAALWSLPFLLSPVFGSFIVWRNWANMKRPRRATLASSWFWVSLTLVAVAVITTTKIPLWIFGLFYVAWFIFSALPQIRYVRANFRKPYPKRKWFLPLAAGLAFYAGMHGVNYLAEAYRKTPLAQASQPTTTQPVATQVATDRTFTPDEIRELYKSSVLEVRSTWKQRAAPAWSNKSQAGSNGTGVLLCNDTEYGLVATNWHVVEPSESMTGDYSCGVRFSSDKEFSDCLLVARAKNEIDLALLLVRLDGKWKPNQFPVRPLDHIREGEACVAIGNALGEGLSITAGIISRFDKMKDITLIRTSTPVSPGNSGGPLILCKGGTLAGIVTLASRNSAVQNVNFATPAQYLLNKNGWTFDGDQPQAEQLLDKAVAQNLRTAAH